MSEIENIARHIVRQEEERQVEKIKLESERKSLEEVLEHGISTEFVEEEVIYIYSPKTSHDMREKLEENYNQLHAQLTIPESIAERLINFIEINHGTDFLIEELLDFKNMERSHCFEPDLKLHDFLQNYTNICVLYLASKALGVDLVKVGEG